MLLKHILIISLHLVSCTPIRKRTIQHLKIGDSVDSNQMSSFSIDMKSYSDLSQHVESGCSFESDELIMISCGDGWTVFDRLDNFLSARD